MTDGPPSSCTQILGDFGEGGDGRLAVGLARALARRGAHTRCISLKAGGIRAVPGDVPERIDLGANEGLGSVLRGILRLRRLARADASGVFHAHGPSSLLFVSLALAGLRRHPRLWFTWHDSGSVLERGGLKERLIRRCARRADRLFGSSRQVADRLARALGNDREVLVFQNGVEPGRVSRAVDAAVPRIVWMARFVPPKDPQILIRAAARLRREGRDFRLVMAGDALPHLQWFHDETRALTEELDLASIVEFPGWIDDPSPMLEDAAIAVQTSHTEGLSMALLEQMMAGLAVVATDVGDTAVPIAHERAGLLIPPRDEDALVDALRRLLDDPALRTQLGREAHRRALESFSFDAIAAQYLAWSESRPN